MSRIGKQPIELPSGVMVALSPGRVQVNGPLGELSQTVPLRMTIEKAADMIVVTRPTDRGEDRSLHGLTRTLIAKAARPQRFKTRAYTRCNRCGRPRAVYKKFGLCRICLRELAHLGVIPGMTKSSW